MIDIGTGLSLGKNVIASAEEAVRQARNQKSAKTAADLAIVFATADYIPSALLSSLNKLLGSTPLIGATAPAIITNQGIFKHGIALMLLSFPDGVYFNCSGVSMDERPNALQAGELMGERLLYGFKNVPRSLGLLFLDRINENSPEFVFGLQEKLGKSFPCIGASVCLPEAGPAYHTFCNETALANGCAGILWGGRLSFGLGIKHGWKPLGKPHTITQSYKNIIYRIDDKPAVELYAEYLGYEETRIRKEFKKISLLYPLGIRMPGQKDYLLKNLYALDDTGAFLTQGAVTEGTVVSLMIHTHETALSATTEAVEEAQASLAIAPAKAHRGQVNSFGLVFDSMLRVTTFGREAKRELAALKNSVPAQTPFIGMCTYTELAPLKSDTYRGQTYFQDQSISVVLIEG